MPESQPDKLVHKKSNLHKQVLVVWILLMAGSLGVLGLFDWGSPRLMNYLESKNPRIFYDRAKILAQEEKYPEALETLQKALSILPSEYSFLMLQGDILEKQDKLDEAYPSFAKAEKTDSKRWEPPFRMGVILSKKKDYKAAVVYLQKAAAINSSERWVYNALAWSAFEDKQMDVAYQAFEKASELAPQSPDYPLMMGKILASRNQWSQALTLFQKSFSVDSTCIDAFLGAGQACLKMGDKSNARTYYQQALKLDPANPLALKELADI